jgi:hypothetical protein
VIFSTGSGSFCRLGASVQTIGGRMALVEGVTGRVLQSPQARDPNSPNPNPDPNPDTVVVLSLEILLPANILMGSGESPHMATDALAFRTPGLVGRRATEPCICLLPS